jgi:hypothetical protein
MINIVLKSFPDHKGIPGHQGGSLPMDSMEEIDYKLPYGTRIVNHGDLRDRGSYFIMPDGNLVEFTDNDLTHAEFATAYYDVNGGKGRLMDLMSEGGIRITNWSGFGIDGYKLGTTALKKVQDLFLDEKLAYRPEDTDVTFDDVSDMNMVYDIFTFPQFMSANKLITISDHSHEDRKRFVLKESKIVRLKGGPGSGAHGHKGIPGHWGGGLPTKGTVLYDSDFLNSGVASRIPDKELRRKIYDMKSTQEIENYLNFTFPMIKFTLSRGDFTFNRSGKYITLHAAKDLAYQFSRVVHDFPDILNKMKYLNCEETEAIAGTNTDTETFGINLNIDYFNNDKAMFMSLMEGSESGWFSSGAYKDTGYYITHELGHMLMDGTGISRYVNKIGNNFVNQLTEASLIDKFLHDAETETKPSIYAKSSKYETFAETFAAMYYNDLNKVNSRNILPIRMKKFFDYYKANKVSSNVGWSLSIRDATKALAWFDPNVDISEKRKIYDSEIRPIFENLKKIGFKYSDLSYEHVLKVHKKLFEPGG